MKKCPSSWFLFSMLAVIFLIIYPFRCVTIISAYKAFQYKARSTKNALRISSVKLCSFICTIQIIFPSVIFGIYDIDDIYFAQLTAF